jgi:hypothetical protein
MFALGAWRCVRCGAGAQSMKTYFYRKLGTQEIHGPTEPIALVGIAVRIQMEVAEARDDGTPGEWSPVVVGSRSVAIGGTVFNVSIRRAPASPTGNNNDPTQAPPTLRETLLKTPSALALGMAAWCVVLAFSDLNPPFVGSDPRWPFQLSGWALCVGSILLGIQYGQKTWRGFAAFVVAVLFNPIAPIRFNDAWPTVELITAAGLMAAAPATLSLFYKRKSWARFKHVAQLVWGWSILSFLTLFGIALLGFTIWAYVTGHAQKWDAERAEKERTKYHWRMPTAENRAKLIEAQRRWDENAMRPRQELTEKVGTEIP